MVGSRTLFHGHLIKLGSIYYPMLTWVLQHFQCIRKSFQFNLPLLYLPTDCQAVGSIKFFYSSKMFFSCQKYYLATICFFKDINDLNEASIDLFKKELQFLPKMILPIGNWFFPPKYFFCQKSHFPTKNVINVFLVANFTLYCS